jgi:uncharacterized protein (DUF433 family)
VPVTALFENIEDGATVQDFLEWFPGVTAQQARSVLEHAARVDAVNRVGTAGYVEVEIP